MKLHFNTISNGIKMSVETFNMTLPTLYNVSKNGKKQFWKIYVKDDLVYRESWYENGKVRVFPPIECTEKNVNKSNATTIKEQAILECNSKYNAQFKKGYKIWQESQEGDGESSSSVLYLPMLAQKFTEKSKHIQLPCGVSRKLDGIRMIAHYSNNQVQLTSRTGKEFFWMNIVRNHIEQILKQFPGVLLDGEIYSHTLPFSILCGAVRSVKAPSTYDDILEYWIFDIADESKTYKERVEIMKQIQTWYNNKFNERCIKFEFYEEIDNLDLVQRYHDKYVSEGFEGLIIRNLGGLYKFKFRTNDLQKYKNFEDAEFKIVDYKAGQGTEKGAIIFVCESKNGLTFDVRPRGSIENRIEQYRRGRTYVGKDLIVRYQPHVKTSDQLKDDLPRFPVGIEIRDYE